MNKDDHLIYESLVQSRAPMSDEQAAKMITDKIKGTPNLNIQNIKMYVQKYLGLVGKAPSDIDFIASMVHDNLQNMGMGENAEDSADARKERTQKKWQMNKNRWAKWKMENPEAAAKHAAKKQGKSEDAERGAQTIIYLDLYTGKTSLLPQGDFEKAIEGLEKVKGKITVYRGEEYMVLVLP